MKRNKFIKYSLMAIFLFVGILGLNVDVEAAGGGSGRVEKIVCNYKFETVEDYIAGERWFQRNITVEFKLSSYKTKDGYTYYKVVSDNVKPRYDTYGSDVIVKKDTDNCPSILIYQRRNPLGNKNTNKFYVFGDDNSKNETDLTITDACTGKGENDEVLSGYRCGNRIGPLTGNDVTPAGSDGSCSKQQVNSAKAKRSEIYEQVVIPGYKEELKKIDSAAGVFSTRHDKAVCDSYISQQDKSGRLDSYMDVFSKQYADYLLTLNCKSDQLNTESDAKIFATLTKSYANKLHEYANKKYDECIDSAVNLTEEEIEDAKNENKQDAQERLTDIEAAVDDAIQKMVNLLNDMSLGGPATISCEGLLGDKLLALIKKLLGYVQIAAPILLIVLGIVDFSQAVLSDDKDALKKATSKFIKRAIICVAIFFLPLIINYILKLIDGMPKDPMCGIK